MAKIGNIIDLLEAGAKAEGLRQQAIASNVANLETPGYRRSDIRFEQLLARALESPSGVDLDAIEPELHQPHQTAVKHNGNDVSLEEEIGAMVKNSLRHKTYMRLLAKKYAQIDRAITTQG
ncbi:flagellar basal body rod protein FlgB [Planctomycetota bacterium]